MIKIMINEDYKIIMIRKMIMVIIIMIIKRILMIISSASIGAWMCNFLPFRQ